MKKLSSWYAFLRFEESRYRILGMQIWIFVKNPVFKYEFLWLFFYPCRIPYPGFRIPYSIFHISHSVISHLHLPPKDELIKDEVSLLKVENNVELAHGSKVFVQHFHIPKHKELLG